MTDSTDSKVLRAPKKNKNTKMTHAKVKHLRKQASLMVRGQPKYSRQALAVRYGISTTTVYDILSGRSWKVVE